MDSIGSGVDLWLSVCVLSPWIEHHRLSRSHAPQFLIMADLPHPPPVHPHFFPIPNSPVCDSQPSTSRPATGTKNQPLSHPRPRCPSIDARIRVVAAHLFFCSRAKSLRGTHATQQPASGPPPALIGWATSGALPAPVTRVSDSQSRNRSPPERGETGGEGPWMIGVWQPPLTPLLSRE